MDPERQQQIDRVLQGALDLEDAEREAHLDAACSGDAELRAEVEALLGSSRDELDDEGLIGRVIGAYRIEAKLGEGGMGAVYRARDERLGRPAAIKVVRESQDRGRLRGFTREARLASALNHPNIVTVYDLLESDGMPLLVTEYVEGESLRARIGDGMEVGEAVEIARQVASALEAAHAAGVVHGGVKPENVILRRDGLVKVLDFGIAKLVDDSQEIETEMGPASYMSPEQVRGETVDGRTDVWSLGVMLYEMVAGHRPFRGPRREDVAAAVLTREVERPGGVPEGLSEIVVRALRKPAGERYATASELVAALEGLTERLADGGVRTGETEPSTGERIGAPTNLTEERARLIGRERELQAIVEELRETRLLTVTGPGGTGKTRLATEAGRSLLREFEGGVYFVELAAIRDPALVVSAIANVLGVKEGAGTSLDETVAAFVGDRELLLVLDNFEQVLAAAPFVGRLLEASPRLKALVTSRERLHLSAERELALAPLALPPAGDMTTVEELSGYGAVSLFVDRARTARPGFALETQSEANLRAVAEICRRLDGLPLAIELAAARLRMLMPEALLGKLDRQLKLLTGGAKDGPERQQTMRAAIVWSYDLLDDDERRLFERLSVFSGGWTLDAAKAIDPDLEVLDLLTRLTDKSLVVVEEQGEELRYRMLETIRQYAAERLAESGGAAEARTAHAAWCLELAEAGALTTRPGHVRWHVTLGREVDNLRAALDWCEGEGDAPEIALRMMAATGLYWDVRGLWGEGRSRFERALAASSRAPSRARATALYRLGALARWQSDFERAREAVAESIAMYREIGDRAGAGLALCELASITGRMGDVVAADAMLREGLAEYDRPEDAYVRANLLMRLGTVAYDRKAFDECVAFNEQILALYRQLGDRSVVSGQLYNLGVLAERAGEYARATELLDEGLAIARELDKRPLIARITHYLGKIAGRQGDHARAAELRAEAAREYLTIGDLHMIRFMLEEVTTEAFEREQAERGALLAGARRQLAETGKLPPIVDEAPDEEHQAAAREALGEAEAERAMARGRRLTLDEALDLAFSAASPD